VRAARRPAPRTRPANRCLAGLPLDGTPVSGRSAATVRAQDVTGTTGKVQAPDSSGHRISAGAEYQFGIDYSHLPADPYSGKRTGSRVYAPGTPVAVWR
jgi:hypothetical protein